MSCRSSAGSSAAVSIARIVSGLPDATVQELFHALRRDGDGLRDPTAEDIDRWRLEQQLTVGELGLSRARRESVEKRLWRARQERPDGSDFYAMRRVEAAARQRAVVDEARATGAAVLDEPGDGEYAKGPDGRPTHVWYASYGSNMNRDRFLAYVRGGVFDGASRDYEGCRDGTDPSGDEKVLLPGQVHFAMRSGVWDGGIAFLDDTAHGQSLGRAYRITIEQFDDIVAQENGGRPGGKPTDVNAALLAGRRVGPGVYGTLVHAGDLRGEPVVTFTGSFTARDSLHGSGFRSVSQPSPAYVHTIGKGLQDAYGLSPEQAADYMLGAQGAGGIERDSARQTVAAATCPPRPGVSRPAHRTVSYGSAGQQPLFSGSGTGSSAGTGRSKGKRAERAAGRAEQTIACECGREHQYGSKNHRKCVLKRANDHRFTPETMPESMLGPRPAVPAAPVGRPSVAELRADADRLTAIADELEEACEQALMGFDDAEDAVHAAYGASYASGPERDRAIAAALAARDDADRRAEDAEAARDRAETARDDAVALAEAARDAALARRRVHKPACTVSRCVCDEQRPLGSSRPSAGGDGPPVPAPARRGAGEDAPGQAGAGKLKVAEGEHFPGVARYRTEKAKSAGVTKWRDTAVDADIVAQKHAADARRARADLDRASRSGPPGPERDAAVAKAAKAARAADRLSARSAGIADEAARKYELAKSRVVPVATKAPAAPKRAPKAGKGKAGQRAPRPDGPPPGRPDLYRDVAAPGTAGENAAEADFWEQTVRRAEIGLRHTAQEASRVQDRLAAAHAAGKGDDLVDQALYWMAETDGARWGLSEAERKLAAARALPTVRRASASA